MLHFEASWINHGFMVHKSRLSKIAGAEDELIYDHPLAKSHVFWIKDFFIVEIKPIEIHRKPISLGLKMDPAVVHR